MSLVTVVRSALGRKGFGWRADLVDARDKPFAMLQLSETPLDGVLYERHLQQILDQGATNSCVGNAWATALQLDRILDGSVNVPLPSRRAIYRWARNYDGAAIGDIGTHLRSAAKAVARFGLPPEHTCPFDVRLINSEVPWAAHRAGHDYRGPQGYYRIASGDLDGIRRALSAKKPVVFGLFVPKSFLEPRGPSTIDIDGSPIAGGHAMCAIGFDRDRFRIVNSYGADWRDRGCAWLTNAMMKRALDVWVADFKRSK